MPPNPQLPDFDPFEVLGVTPDDPSDVIKAAWRQAVKEHHPDAAGGTDERIKRINVAYEWLRDPTLRQTWLLAASGRRAIPQPWGPAPGWEPAPVWPVEPDEPPEQTTYDGPRSERIASLVERIAGAAMDELLDLVHGYRPDLRWSIGLARAVEASRRRAMGAAAVWQVRQAVRARLEVLLEDPAIRAAYDDELVGQVVSDRLADLVRGIVLLDVLMPDARARVAYEWDAVMGGAADEPTDEPALGGRPIAPDPLARVPEPARWLVVLLAAAIYATLAVALLPSREAFAAILIGFGVATAFLVRNRRPAA